LLKTGLISSKGEHHRCGTVAEFHCIPQQRQLNTKKQLLAMAVFGPV